MIGYRVLNVLRYFYFNLKSNMLLYLSLRLIVSLVSFNYLYKAFTFWLKFSTSCLLFLSFIFLAFSNCLYFYFSFYTSSSSYFSNFDFSLSWFTFELFPLFSAWMIYCLRFFIVFSSSYYFFFDYCNFFLKWMISSFICSIFWESSYSFL